MKYLIALAVTAIIGLTPFQAQAEIPTGEKVPAMSFVDIEGTTHNLADYAGKYVILEWNNPECPFVKKHYNNGNMQSLQEQAVADDMVWITINSSAEGKQGYFESNETAIKNVEEKGINSTAYIRDTSGTIGKAFSAKTTPHMYVIDPDGTLIYQGAIDNKPSADPADIATSENYVMAALEASKKDEDVETGTSAPYGCAVKY